MLTTTIHILYFEMKDSDKYTLKYVKETRLILENSSFGDQT